MKSIHFFPLFFSLAFLACPKNKPDQSPDKKGHTYHLYFLGGQSNMDGYGFTSELPKGMGIPQKDVLIFHSTPRQDSVPVDGKGRWRLLVPGHGAGYSFDGKNNDLSDRFGPELSFGKRMSKLMPGEKIAIIKYAMGGTALELGASGYGTWAPDYLGRDGINQYDHFLATMRNALSISDIDGDGAADQLIPSGIAWMQGEADAYHSMESAQKYEANLKRLMDLIRATLRVDDLPVAIGLISDSGKDADGKVMDYCDIVQKAQADFVAKDGQAALIKTTSNCDFLEDGWHYVSECYLRMGEDMAEAIFEMEKQN